MSRPIIPTGGNDRVMTPLHLAAAIVNHFKPAGMMLEPCAGSGAFLRAFEGAGLEYDWCEIDQGRDFLALNPVAGHDCDWVVSNPPWSQFRAFLNQSMRLAPNIVFLSLVNAFFMKARIRDMRAAGFGFKEVLFVDTPAKETGWPQMGIQLGAIHIQHRHKDDCRFSYLSDSVDIMPVLT